MSWVRIDDSAPDHPKLIDMDDVAFATWVRALCYAAKHATDGRIPLAALRKLTSHRRPGVVAERLVEARLWEREVRADGTLVAYQVHDFLRYHPSRESSNERRIARAAAGRLGGIRSGEVRSKVEAGHEAKSKQLASTKTNPAGGRTRDPDPDPVPIPDPDQSSSSNAREAKPVEIPSGLLALAQVLAAEGSGLGASVLERATKGWLPTPKQRAALEAIRSEREAKGADVGAPSAPPRGPREPTRRELEAMSAEGERHGMSPASFVTPPRKAAGGRRYHYPTPEELAVAGSSNGAAAVDEHEVLPTLAELATRR